MIRRERRDGGEGVERRLRNGAEGREIEKETKGNIRNIDTCLCLLLSFLKAQPEFPTRFCSSRLGKGLVSLARPFTYRYPKGQRLRLESLFRARLSTHVGM